MQNRIDAYARLLLTTGLGLKRGMNLVISCPVECAPFARLCAKEAYALGCREVIMNWSDDVLSRLKHLHADDEIFDSVHPWTAGFYNTVTAENCAWLAIHAADPEALSGVSPDRIRRAAIASGRELKPFRDRQMRHLYPWCVASVPAAKWAKKVFPDLPEEKAIEKLWLSILDCCRVWDGGDAAEEWRRHIAALQKRVDILNGYAFSSLHFKNSLGTDLSVELAVNHIWSGGGDETPEGHFFCANMPTEEIFSAPKRGGVNGIVYASRPLSLSGSLVEDFSFTIKDGKIISLDAKTGGDVLQSAISVDEGASYLGEVALVPYDSPISRSGILFYNTLFDENASCHLAFGEAYPSCVTGGAEMTREEQSDAGLNYSVMHEDFMIGTADLSVTGITADGERVPVMADGNFVF